MTLLAVLSLFFAEPVPLDMPRAEGYLVRDDKSSWLEDRYDRTELWMSQTTIGRWMDEAGRMFLLARLDACPPAIGRHSTLTRVDYAAERVPMKRVRANADFPPAFADAVTLLAPCPVAASPRASRQLPRGYREVCYWQDPTNFSDIVCTFLPEGTNVWYLGCWTLAETDDYPTQMNAFENQFLRREFPSLISRLKSSDGEGREALGGRREGEDGRRERENGRRERELLRRDARHSVAAYANWHFTDAEEFAVIDDLPARGFIETLTNDFPVMRAKYAAALPTPFDGSNVLCVTRLYADRGEYLEALEVEDATNMAWSAAYWSSKRRELVAYLPANGTDELLRTIRHEAFHQYLAYATLMTPTSPWLNEGYAQYFEDDACTDWGVGFDVRDESIDRMSAAIPGVLLMDYAQFYDGSDFERRFKYRLAWSLVRFIEQGADEVRLKPFAGLKERYLRELVETGDMRKATSAAFRDADLLKKFIAEWKKFWKNS